MDAHIKKSARQPDVSIIIPFYDSEKYLHECVSSVAGQSWKNIEIILVDDGSRDRSPIISAEWAAKDARVRIVSKKNGGISSARNAGVRTSRAEYVLFVDSDDLLRMDAVERLLSVAQGHDFVVFGYVRVNDAGHLIDHEILGCPDARITSIEDYRRAILLGEAENYAWTRLYSKHVLDRLDGPFDEKVSFLEDVEFTRRLCSVSTSIGVVPLPLYLYRFNENSLTHAPNPRRAMDGLAVIEGDPWSLCVTGLPREERSIAENRIIGTLFMCYDLASGSGVEAYEARKKIWSSILREAGKDFVLGHTNKWKLAFAKMGLYRPARAFANARGRIKRGF